ncbi:MAG TPA: NUDIX hydrolase [Thermoanaerobaculia bacterium]|jgi:8-oxo-dGTP diphosphatase|nr:NUDIX hydrolase [Thermoanaerobaculia bacterium]
MAGKGRRRQPRLTVDAWIEDPRGRVLLVKRARAPFRGSWAFPGGFCEWGETMEESCAREALEETGMKVRIGDVLGVYSAPDRDPRGHTVSVLYEAKPIGGTARGGDDASDARWFAPAELAKLDLAFDHAKIVREQLPQRRHGRRSSTGLRARRPRAHSRRARPGGARG